MFGIAILVFTMMMCCTKGGSHLYDKRFRDVVSANSKADKRIIQYKVASEAGDPIRKEDKISETKVRCCRCNEEFVYSTEYLTLKSGKHKPDCEVLTTPYAIRWMIIHG